MVGINSHPLSLIRFVLQPSKIVVFNGMISRWVIPFAANYTNKTNLICDRANEDNCGTCGNGLLTNNPDVNYHITHHKPMSNIFLNKVFTEDEHYYFPFTL
jgi:hypothetical protein